MLKKRVINSFLKQFKSKQIIMKYNYIEVNNSTICRFPINNGKESPIGEIYSYVHHTWIQTSLTMKFKMNGEYKTISEKEALKLTKEVW